MATGRCLCGEVRYEVGGEPLFTALCHCPSCRRSTGAPVVAWALYSEEALKVTAGQATAFASSPEIERSFCARCGTSLFFRASYIDGLVDITIASLDEPQSLSPDVHIWHRHHLPWLELKDERPCFEELPPAP